MIGWEFELRERDGAETQQGMSAQISSVHPFFLQPADVGQDSSVMRAFEGRPDYVSWLLVGKRRSDFYDLH